MRRRSVRDSSTRNSPESKSARIAPHSCACSAAWLHAPSSAAHAGQRRIRPQSSQGAALHSRGVRGRSLSGCMEYRGSTARGPRRVCFCEGGQGRCRH